ncbi:F-box only protein 4-like isoform X1 [Dreissena polymorpha]|nr:F-box only protein 4-like isoform X1 [Dreissena polymorpha]
MIVTDPLNKMIAVQSIPNSFNGFEMGLSNINKEEIFTTQPQALSIVEFRHTKIEHATEVSLIDHSSAMYFRLLIKKYKKHMGEEMGSHSVCSGGLQQYLIKQRHCQVQLKEDQEDKSQQQSGFECLPVDVRLHIFSYLTATELCRASTVCRSWYDITEDNLLWARLLAQDIHQWDVIGHNTNPAIYKEVESEWSNKEIYLRCSPGVKKLMHQNNAMFSNVTSMLRYLFPKKTPMFAMFGPGLESHTSGIVRQLIHESDFTKMAMFPGKFDGVGGGITLKSPGGALLHLSVLYSNTEKEREKVYNVRQHKMMRVKEDASGNDKYEMMPAVQDFCETVDGFIYVVDASAECPAVESGLSELLAMVNERWSATHVPVLVLSTTPEQTTPRISCFEVVERLALSKLNRPWQVWNCSIENLSGVEDGLTWLTEQTRRKY